MAINDDGARRLMAAILKQAHQDYFDSKACPVECPFKTTCGEEQTSKEFCDARQFIHSAWAATICEELGVDHKAYVMACIKNRSLSGNTYRYVENEIKQYKNMLQEIETIKKDIILETQERKEGRGSEKGDPTLNKVIKMGLSKKIAKMEKTVKAIEKIYNSLPKDKKMVMQEYWHGMYTNQGIAKQTGVDERTIRRWKQLIVYSVAIELKYL